MNAPIRVRLTAAFALTLTLVLVAVGIFVYFRFRDDADHAIDAELRVRADAFFGERDPDRQLRVALLGLSDEHFGQALDARGRVTAASEQLTARPIAAASPVGYRTVTVTTRAEPRRVRILVARRGSTTLLLASALDDRDDAQGHLANLLWVGGGLTLVVATGLAWLLAGAALAPVERLRRAAVEYSATDLEQRLTVPAANDEVHRLAVTLNEMLDRIQTSFDRQRAFVDRASHELRTPVANLSLELELALRRERDPEELRAALRSAASEAQRLDRLASNLLALARMSDGATPIAREPTDLRRLVDDTVSSFVARAAEAGVGLVAEMDTSVEMALDPVEIRRALTNVIDNALRMTPRGGSVAVRLGVLEHEVTIAVVDSGPGFPPELVDSAFGLFVRGPIGDRSPDGAGLGLAIVAAIVEAHGGTVAIESTPTGATVVMTLPRARSTAA